MALSIDPQRCQGHGRCSLISPELFDVDDDGFGTVLIPEPGPQYAAAAALAAGNCPEAAIAYVPAPDASVPEAGGRPRSEG